MKKIWIVPLLTLSAGLNAQERVKNNFWELSLATRIESAHNLYGVNTKILLPLSVTVLEFSAGAPRIYFYGQFRFSSHLSNLLSPKISYYNPFPVYGRRLGFLVGIGGVVYDSRKGVSNRGWTLRLNFGVGGEFPLAKTIVLNAWIYPSLQAPIKYALLSYYLFELNFMVKYHIYQRFGIQFGFNLSMSGTDIFSGRSFHMENGVTVISHEEWNISYGLSLGFVF